jgi:OOP family OmpA-OmpF porin
LLASLASLALTGCSRDAEPPAPTNAGAPANAAQAAASTAPEPPPAKPDPVPAAAAQPSAEAGSEPAVAAAEGVPEIPPIPAIVVPDIVGVGPAQRALEAALAPVPRPIAGVSVRPASCDASGRLIADGGITRIDENGAITRNGDEGIFRIRPDGSGTANFEGAIIRVGADGSGSYNGPLGIIRLDGQGGGTWNGDTHVGIVRNHGDGSGTWNGPQGIVRIAADGSGTWNGPQGLVRNHGDGTGTVGTPGRKVAMAPLPKVPPAGRFPPLKKFAPPGVACGFVVTLSDAVLFDFDKADIRPDAAFLLDTLARALDPLSPKGMEIGGHTDGKGSDAYNQALSERRAQAVAAAMRERGAATQAQVKGYGKSQPVAPNAIQGEDNPAGRQLNRRVEIFVRT